jgi:hypothetical protein
MFSLRQHDRAMNVYSRVSMLFKKETGGGIGFLLFTFYFLPFNSLPIVLAGSRAQAAKADFEGGASCSHD